ncbi:MAG: DUF4124 domain-containing protein [Azoarcus sp.]|nr:DUF4124 domain-containing protein [Azoarcus sp.]
MKRLVQLAVPVLALLAALPTSAEVYKWKDKDGKIHFSDMRPNQENVTPLNTRSQPLAVDKDSSAGEEGENTAQAGETGEKPEGTASGASAVPKTAPPKSIAERELEFRQRRAAKAEAEAKAEKENDQATRRAGECERARNQFKALTSGQRIARPTADGGRAFLTDDERNAEISRTRELVDAFCDGD